MTVYDYFFKKTAEAEAKTDEEAVAAATNRDSLLERKESRIFKSMQENPSNFPFDDDEEEEHKEEGYAMMEDEPIEGYAVERKEEPGLLSRAWTGAGEIFTTYHKRTRALDRHTGEAVRGAIDGIMESRREESSHVLAERTVYLTDTNKLQTL